MSFRVFDPFTLDNHDLIDDKPPIDGEMWFFATDQLVSAIAGLREISLHSVGLSVITLGTNALATPSQARL